MRTSIFISGMLIADALNHQMKPDQLVTTFCAVLFLVFASMDLIDFIRKLIKYK